MAQARLIYHPSLEWCVQAAKEAFAAKHSSNLSFIRKFQVGPGTQTLLYANEVIGFALSEDLVPPPLILNPNPSHQKFEASAESCAPRGRHLDTQYDQFDPEFERRSASCPPLGRPDADTYSDHDLGLDEETLQTVFINTMTAPSRMMRMLGMSTGVGGPTSVPVIMLLGLVSIYKSEIDDALMIDGTLRMDEFPLSAATVPAVPLIDDRVNFQAFPLNRGIDPAQLAEDQAKLRANPQVYNIDPAIILHFVRMLYQNSFPEDIDELDVMAYVINQLKRATELAETSLRSLTTQKQSEQLRFLMVTRLGSLEILKSDFSSMDDSTWDSQGRSFTGLPREEPLPESFFGGTMPRLDYIQERMRRAVLLEWMLVSKILLEKLEESVFYAIQRLEGAGERVTIWNLANVRQVADILARSNGIASEWTPPTGSSFSSSSNGGESRSNSASPTSEQAYMDALKEEEDCSC